MSDAPPPHPADTGAEPEPDLSAAETALRAAQTAYDTAVKSKPAPGAAAQLDYLDNLANLHAAAITATREFITAKYQAGRLSKAQYEQFQQRDAQAEHHQQLHATALQRMSVAARDTTPTDPTT